jgi:hypothetical protein
MKKQINCKKCQDVGIYFQYLHTQDSYTATAKWCDCPAANWITARQLVAFERALTKDPQLWSDIFAETGELINP